MNQQTKTYQIFSNNCPYNHSCQGPSKRLLFVCTAGLLRSPTCAAEGAKRGYNTRSCGSSVSIALIPISEQLIKWADKIIFMLDENEDKVLKYLKSTNNLELYAEVCSKSIIFGIEDSYNYGEEGLINIINRKFDKYELEGKL